MSSSNQQRVDAKGPAGTPLATAVRAALATDNRLQAWQMRSLRRSGFQTYLVKTELESERRTEGESLDATVFVKNGDRVGSATLTLVTGDEGTVARRIDEAVYMAGLGGDTPWALPAASSLPTVEVADMALTDARAQATSRDLAATWRSAIAAEPGVRPSSMELFCGEEWRVLENSAGLVASAHKTRVSLLTLVLADGERVSERYSWVERRRVADLDVGAIVRHAAAEARDLTRAVLPPSGQYPVVIDADEMPAFLSPIRANAAASTLYQQSSRFEVGKPLPIETHGGEPLTVISNALLPYGLGSDAFDATGVAGRRVEIVKDGVFVRPWASKQYADYLAIEATGDFANWELPAGTQPLADLTAGEGPVLYVRSFSDLTPDDARGNFASEIRLGYLYKNGERTPVRGGTVSGNVLAALGTARATKETLFLGDYLGPAAIRFEGLTVAGA